MRVFNFSAGPAVLPESVLRRAADEMQDWHGSGMSVMEMSHRGKEFISIFEKTEADFRQLLNISSDYSVLFLQGGALAMNALIPMNLLGDKTTADYVNTGEWSKKSIQEAKKYCTVNVAASSEDQGFSYVPAQADWKLNKNAAYVHVCTNETIGGVEYQWVPETGDVPLVADMSSHILSREMDVSRYAVIYGGAQKNIGPAGLTFCIVRKDLLDKIDPRLKKANTYIGTLSIVLALISSIILKVIDVLNKLDFFLKKCGATLAPLDQSLLDLEEINKNIDKAQQTSPDSILYKGFTLEIVKKPYNNKVNQNIGVAKNQYGIILLQTNPSFTTTPQVLIDELKLIIDRDNLKAY
jgi:phosphoserine aminotransferase